MTLLAAILLTQTPKVPLSITIDKAVPGLRPVAFAASPVGCQVVVCMEDGSVRIIDAKTRQTTRNLAKHIQSAYGAAWSSDGAWIATGDETARIFIEDPRNGSKVREYRTHTRGIQKISFDRSRKYIASTGKDDVINVYDTSDPLPKEIVHILGKGSNFYGAEFNPNGGSIISTGILSDAGRTYDGTTGKVDGFYSYAGGEGTFDTAYNPSGTRLVTAGRDATASIWDTKTKKKLASLRGHQDWVVDVAYSPNGQLIATSSSDRTVKIWNAFTYAKVGELTDQSGVGSPLAWTADGNFLLTVNLAGEMQVNKVSPSQCAVIVKPTPVIKPKPKPKTKLKKRGG